MLQAYHLKFKNLLNSQPKIFEEKLDVFRPSSKELFEILPFKCRNIFKCTYSKQKKNFKRTKIHNYDRQHQRLNIK